MNTGNNIDSDYIEYCKAMWNCPTVQYASNCYSHALNTPFQSLWGKVAIPERFRHPLHRILDDAKFYKNYFVEILELDGCMFCGNNDELPIVPGSCYPIACFMFNEGNDIDYHFYRGYQNGYWSHQVGKGGTVEFFKMDSNSASDYIVWLLEKCQNFSSDGF